VNHEQLVKQEQLAQHKKQEQIFSAVLDRASTDPRFARKVLEVVNERRKLVYGPDITCLQWGFPNSVTGIPVNVAGGGTALSVDYNLNAMNNCPTPISNVEFVGTEMMSCPVGCAEASIQQPAEFFGVPSTIAQGKTSAGKSHHYTKCDKVDASGAKTPTMPTRMSTSVYLLGQQDGTLTQTLPQTFNIYP